MRVAVVGGGISGLAAADHLLRSGAEVVLLEGADRLGGKLRRAEVAGLTLDVGAESAIARGPAPTMAELITDLGLPVVKPTGARSSVYVDQRPVAIPPQVLGVPYDLDQLGGLLTDAGLRRARQEADQPAPALDEDVAIGRLVAERFGDEVVDRLLEPMLGGVYAGHARELSFESVSPALYERARGGGALSDHARAMVPAASAGSPFVGTPGGMGAVVEALSASLITRGAEVRTGVTVRELATDDAGGWQLTCGPVPAPEVIGVDRVVLATPAVATARLLAELAPIAAQELGAIRSASVAVVTLVVSGADLSGSGMLVPPGMLPTIKAFTHSSLKWDWVAEQVRTLHGEGAHAVRVSIGRAGQEQVLQLDDEVLVVRTLAEARTVPGWSGAEVIGHHVQRWGGGLPQYAVGHRTRMARAGEDLATLDGLAACGAYWDGVGIAACLRTARRAAKLIMENEMSETRSS